MGASKSDSLFMMVRLIFVLVNKNKVNKTRRLIEIPYSFH